MRVFFWRGVRLGLSVAVLVALALVVAIGCGGDDDGGDSGKVKVVTTLPLFADFVREVGGDRVEVTSLVPSGADPHTWEPSPSDVKKVAEADIAFANGLDLEPAAIRLIDANLTGDAPLVLLANAATPVGPYDSKDPNDEIDPHLWMDPREAEKFVRVINEEMRKIDASALETYKNNTLAYIDTLGVAQLEATTIIQSVPPGNRKLVTTHDAFGRLETFGLQVVAVVSTSPGQEPSPEDVADIVRVIEDEEVPAVFREPQIDAEGRILEQAAKDAGVQVCTLYSDSLDDRVTSYVEMMRFNAEEIARCLGGDGGG